MPIRLPSPDEVFLQQLDFDTAAEMVWAWQRAHNAPMAEFCGLMQYDGPEFMPIEFFKDYELRCDTDWKPELVFRSSGTSGDARSTHFVRHAGIYRRSACAGFKHFFKEGQYTVFALLPSYLERQDASLVWMVTEWIKDFGAPGSGFYLDNFAALRQALAEAMDRRERILLIGVSFALLEFVEKMPIKLPPDAIVMETGGMKGKGEELVRADLHERLKAGFGLEKIYSEYGMTELLSQAYSDGTDRFRCPPWMRVVITDPYLPGVEVPFGEAGRINVIDLANMHSCSFIRTDDVGRAHEDGSFEVLGRLDHAELRGCNLMYVG
jgi:hypothetical protein